MCPAAARRLFLIYEMSSYIICKQVRDLLCPASELEGKKFNIVAGENGSMQVSDLISVPVLYIYNIPLYYIYHVGGAQVCRFCRFQEDIMVGNKQGGQNRCAIMYNNYIHGYVELIGNKQGGHNKADANG